MSSLFDLLGSQLGGSNLQQMSGGIADQLGIDPGQASAAVASAMPLLLGALAKNASTPHGANQLSSVLDRDHDGSVLDDLGSAFSGGASASGMRAVNHIFGADSASVTNHIGQQSGLDMAQVTKILAMLAPIVLGFLGTPAPAAGQRFRPRQPGLDVRPRRLRSGRRAGRRGRRRRQPWRPARRRPWLAVWRRRRWRRGQGQCRWQRRRPRRPGAAGGEHSGLPVQSALRRDASRAWRLPGSASTQSVRRRSGSTANACAPGAWWLLLGGLLFDAPLLRVASGDAWLGGLPRGWVYLFEAWACLITLIALAARAPSSGD